MIYSTATGIKHNKRHRFGSLCSWLSVLYVVDNVPVGDAKNSFISLTVE